MLDFVGDAFPVSPDNRIYDSFSIGEGDLEVGLNETCTIQSVEDPHAFSYVGSAFPVDKNGNSVVGAVLTQIGSHFRFIKMALAIENGEVRVDIIAIDVRDINTFVWNAKAVPEGYRVDFSNVVRETVMTTILGEYFRLGLRLKVFHFFPFFSSNRNEQIVKKLL